MKIIVIGSGGREHAIAKTLLQSPQVQQVVCIPGNGGTARLKRCENLPLKIDQFQAIADYAKTHAIDLIIVGPEAPLALGITDALQSHNLTVFGPTQAGAQIEASKAWAKALMSEASIPTAASAVFTDETAARAYLQSQGAPIVIKADGLASGKGVTVAMTLEEANAAIAEAFAGKFGSAGQKVVIEEYLTGQEASILALTDGETIRPLISAQDHKRIGEGDTGPNTGGMGAYAPAPVVTPELSDRINQEILLPTIKTLKKWEITYRGVLYAGLMITPEGDPKVIEFNCRFGDPEIQAILPLLETPLETLLLATAQGKLAQQEITWKPGACACVVAASDGYPGSFEQGFPITGIEVAEAQGAIVFEAGTSLNDNRPVTSGGRVLGVTGVGATHDLAFDKAYQAIASIYFQGLYYRRDIGHRVRQKQSQ
ncbi:phosphoribosylamine--glycine ligase [Roseofilum reptotaenium CS-1145]|uniref:Phosphoribosylamine--glycine ligase n=1 Tax=Roseofilum reptotaenium AO1-A TaxID=1925591 RepID=A0A1L9QUI2_9CYAN|nr:MULTISPECIES: phosphoribosylamine--glycine ligase [Roseofilum]MBP0028030.1 phosphoribosylamine--glycine ligase [Roseofilum sp. Guam]MDB9517720.1 phosphoribosylamine--glycine ligase [Roseofilum reptotaenium CS-1145]OJJ26328.1 phosphoribosylamine--glycine ligase [Roseofilum reptotaenium AO1-A]